MRLQATGISEDQLLVTVLPGLPTTAEIFIVPATPSRPGPAEEKWAHLDQVAERQRGFEFSPETKKQKASERRGGQGRLSGEEKTSPRESLLHLRVSPDSAEALLFKDNKEDEIFYLRTAFIFFTKCNFVYFKDE